MCKSKLPADDSLDRWKQDLVELIDETVSELNAKDKLRELLSFLEDEVPMAIARYRLSNKEEDRFEAGRLLLVQRDARILMITLFFEDEN